MVQYGPLKGVINVKKEILYRATRIILMLFILITFTLIRKEVKESYDNINKNLLTNLQITNLKNIKKDEDKKYKVKIKNQNNKEKEIKFKLEQKDSPNQIKMQYINYEILKNNEKVYQGKISQNKIIYKDTLKKQEQNIYEIKFIINENINNKKDKSFKAQIKII